MGLRGKNKDSRSENAIRELREMTGTRGVTTWVRSNATSGHGKGERDHPYPLTQKPIEMNISSFVSSNRQTDFLEVLLKPAHNRETVTNEVCMTLSPDGWNGSLYYGECSSLTMTEQQEKLSSSMLRIQTIEDWFSNCPQNCSNRRIRSFAG